MREQWHNLAGSQPPLLAGDRADANGDGDPLSPQLSRDGPLRLRQPDLFAQLLMRYQHALDAAVEQRHYKSTRSASAELSEIARQLDQERAGARDVIELHHRALEHRFHTASPLRARAYLEEGRLLVLELMGRLLTHYRAACVAAEKQSVKARHNRHAPSGAGRGDDHG